MEMFLSVQESSRPLDLLTTRFAVRRGFGLAHPCVCVRKREREREMQHV